MKGVNKMFEIKYCPKCKDNKNFQNEYHTDWNPVQGYFIAFSPSDDICPYCKEKIKSTHMDYDNFKDILSVSTDERFVDTMISLYNNDIIEYELKMSQFRNQLEQKRSNERTQRQQQTQNTPKCPTCGSTNIEKISVGKKISGSMLFGIFSSDVRNTMHCKDCGAKW